MSRLKLIPWVVGVVLVVGSVAGANRLLQADQPAPNGGGGDGKAKPAPHGPDALIATGVVAAEQDLVAYVGSPLLASARVAEVSVKEGDEVPAGKPLYKFDDAAALADIAKAKAQVGVYERKLELAQHQKETEMPILLLKANQAVSAAKRQRDIAREGYDATKDEVEKGHKAYKDPFTQKPYEPDEIARKVKTDERVLRTQAALELAEAAIKEKESDVQRVQKAPYAEQVKEADAAVALAKAELAKAELVAKEYVVTAKVAGVVERLEAAPGLVVGPATRTPLLWLVPKGPRVVRAEVVPEFAFKVQSKVGQKVTILDDNNAALTYAGEVQRVSESFLPRRAGGAEFLTGKPQLVLEVVVAITDPAPPGKPPLRVGQPVRVSIGQ